MNGMSTEARPDTVTATTTTKTKDTPRSSKSEVADAFALAVMPIVIAFWAKGTRSRSQIVKQLNDLGVASPAGKRWTATALRNLLARIGVFMAPEHQRKASTTASNVTDVPDAAKVRTITE
jgi:hypothetical protein